MERGDAIFLVVLFLFTLLIFAVSLVQRDVPLIFYSLYALIIASLLLYRDWRNVKFHLFDMICEKKGGIMRAMPCHTFNYLQQDAIFCFLGYYCCKKRG